MTQAEKEVSELQEGFCPTCRFQDAGCTKGVLDEYKDIPGAFRPGEDVECEEWKPGKVTVEIVCAWCKCLIVAEEWDWYPGLPRTSHGICPRCSEKMLSREKEDT